MLQASSGAASSTGPALRADELLVVSHRWAAKELPYNGDEIYRLQEYLRSTGTIVEGKNVYEKKFVWLDYWSASPRVPPHASHPTCLTTRLTPPPARVSQVAAAEELRSRG